MGYGLCPGYIANKIFQLRGTPSDTGVCGPRNFQSWNRCCWRRTRRSCSRAAWLTRSSPECEVFYFAFSRRDMPLCTPLGVVAAETGGEPAPEIQIDPVASMSHKTRGLCALQDALLTICSLYTSHPPFFS
jgi:hypothetical protein